MIVVLFLMSLAKQNNILALLQKVNLYFNNKIIDF